MCARRENADYVIASGQADMVSIVRGQIADPHLANKARDGRPEDVRPCLSCNQMCWGRRSREYWISCLVNPSAGREFEWGGDRFEPASVPKSVLVVGGGPAGLETARVAAERGHAVTLVEASNELGGSFRLAGLQPRRGQVTDLIDWYRGQLEKLQVQVRYNTPMEAADVRSENADVVVLATGSLPGTDGFQRWLPETESMPGIERGNVYTAEDVMSRACRPGRRVVVLDEAANYRGVGTAWHLAEQGHDVTIVTPAASVAKDVERTSSDAQIRSRLRRLGVAFRVESAISEWHGDGATVRDLLDGSEERVEADTLVLACTNLANTMLEEDLNAEPEDGTTQVITIGDCVAPRTAVMAIYEGRKIARQL